MSTEKKDFDEVMLISSKNFRKIYFKRFPEDGEEYEELNRKDCYERGGGVKEAFLMLDAVANKYYEELHANNK
jgi:isocitrate dehydrogenase kinase/phosphatase